MNQHNCIYNGGVMAKKSKKNSDEPTVAPRSASLERTVIKFLDDFNNQYHSFQDKTEGRERQARLKEDLRAYTNDLRSEVVRKKAIEVWNTMSAELGMGFGEAKDYVPKEKVEEITQIITNGLDPIMGQVAPIHSKKFLSAIRDSISNRSSKIKDAIGSPLKNFVVPAQDKDVKDDSKYSPEEYAAILNDRDKHVEKIEGVKTKRSELSTFQIDYSLPDIPTKDKKYIIHFNGNAEFAMRTIGEMTLEAKEHQCVVINFDYPGVGESTGASKRSKHMVEAGLAQVKRLTDMGVPPENILLKGQSIGGGTATLTAAKLHKQGQKVSLYNQRSFSKLSTSANQMIRERLKSTAGKVIGTIAAGIIKATGWEMDSIKAWKKIPDAYKDFSFAVNDKVIPADTAGLAGALGKMDDKDRKLWMYVNTDDLQPAVAEDQKTTFQIGHNNDIYNEEFDGRNNVMTVNENGKPTRKMFDDFARKMFVTSEVSLDADQKQQIGDLIRSLKTVNSQPSTSSRVKLLVSSNVNELQKVFGKKATEMLKSLESIEKNGKVTEKQLGDIQHLCQHAQKKAGKKPSEKVNVFLKTANTFIEDTKSKVESNLRRSSSARM
jgi:hypothetical protein